MLKQLDDSSNDVQSIAVKCLGVLLGKVQEAQVGEICDKLCTLVLEGKDELRDIYSIGLKTLIADVPDAMGPSVCRLLTKRSIRSRLACAAFSARAAGRCTCPTLRVQRAVRAATSCATLRRARAAACSSTSSKATRTSGRSFPRVATVVTPGQLLGFA